MFIITTMEHPIALKLLDYSKEVEIYTSGQSRLKISSFSFFPVHRVELSKMVITLEEKCMGPYAIGCLVVSPGPKYDQNII